MRTLSSSFCKAITILPGIRTKQYENGNLGCTHEGFKLQAQCQITASSRTKAPCLSGSRRFCRTWEAALGQTRSRDVCQRRAWPTVPFDKFPFSKKLPLCVLIVHGTVLHDHCFIWVYVGVCCTLSLFPHVSLLSLPFTVSSLHLRPVLPLLHLYKPKWFYGSI